MKSSIQDKAEGKWHKVKGKIKQVAGKAVGNRDLEAEGDAENVDGKVQGKDCRDQSSRWEVKHRRLSEAFDGVKRE
jgi:uncharacterized protein YjbJ (UPF0337 family)